MGFGGISPWSLLLILIIVLLLFGTKRLRNMGGDLGDAIKNFKKSVKDNASDDEDASDKAKEQQHIAQKDSGQIIEGEAKEKQHDASKS